MLEVHRLDPSNPSSWSLYPQFEARLRKFLAIQTPDFGEPDKCIVEMRKRWVETPEICGYWLLMETEGEFLQEAVGHVCGWVQDHYGKPYVLLFQTEVDDHHETRETLIRVVDRARVWITELNEKLEIGKAPLISYIEHWSRKPAEVWNRLIPEIKQQKVYYVIRIPV